MINKLNLGSSLAALILFVFPWLDIQCSERSLVTQSGVEVIYGGGSPSEELEQKGGKVKTKRNGSEDSIRFAPLVGFALLLVLVAALITLKDTIGGKSLGDTLALVLQALALGVLLVQLLVGFPIERYFSSEREKYSEETQAMADGGAKFTRSVAAGMMNVRVERTTALYLELVVLGIPTLILLNGLIDKRRKAAQSSGGETASGV